MKSDNDQQAFPLHDRDDALKGMTLRDYMAAHAPKQLDEGVTPDGASQFLGIPLPDGCDNGKPNKGLSDSEWRKWWLKVEVTARYQFADEMLAARQAASPSIAQPTAEGESPTDAASGADAFDGPALFYFVRDARNAGVGEFTPAMANLVAFCKSIRDQAVADALAKSQPLPAISPAVEALVKAAEMITKRYSLAPHDMAELSDALAPFRREQKAGGK